MTDKELITLVESKLPQELTLEEIELLRRRLRESPAVRKALAGQLQMDQYLSGLIGRIDLSAESVFQAAARAGRSRRASVWAWLGWTACILLIGFVASALLWPVLFSSGDKGRSTDVAQTKDEKDKSPDEATKAAPVNGQPPAEIKPANPPGQIADHDGGKPVPPPNADGPAGQPVQAAAIGNNVPGRIEITAVNVTRGDHWHADFDNWGHGIGILNSAGDHTWVEYEFNVTKGGAYRFGAEYAAAEPRPVKVSINKHVVHERAFGDVTGNWFPQGQKWIFVEGEVRLKNGKNVLRLESTGTFPHFHKLAFVPVGTGDVNVAANRGGPPRIVAAEPQAPRIAPWKAANQLEAAPRTMEEIAADSLDAGPAPSMDDMRQWFTSAPPQGGQLNMQDHWGGKMPVISGWNRFNAPLAENTVLRLAMFEAQSLTIYFWHGDQGIALRCHDDQNKRPLAAYATVRNGADPRPRQFMLAATDDDRNWRTNLSPGPTLMQLDIRFRQGLMVVSRGDVELLRAPFVGPPEDVYFGEGRALIRGLAVVRTSSELPAEPTAHPIAVDMARPADLHWFTQMPGGMVLNKPGDGSVEIKSQNSQQPGWAAFPLPDGGLGLRELVLEVDDITPGSRIGLGSGAHGDPRLSVGFYRDNNNGNNCLSFHWTSYGDGNRDFGINFNGGEAAPYAAQHQWLKFVGGAGIKCYTSLDGRHWARQLQVNDLGQDLLTHVALWCPQSQGQPACGLRLRRATLYKLPAVDALAPPADVMAKAPTIVAPDMAGWEKDLVNRRLDLGGVSPSAWRRACALKSLAAGKTLFGTRGLIDLLLDQALAAPRPLDEQLELLDEMALLTNVAGDTQAASRFMHRYYELGEKLRREGNPRPWSTLAASAARSPLWCNSRFDTGLDRLARNELLELIYAGKPQEVQATVTRLKLWNWPDPLLGWAADWVGRHGDADAAGDRITMRTDRQHPFIEELNKEGFNLLGDFESAVASKSYHDACQIISAADASDSLGLWPNSDDPQLMVSVNGAIDLAMFRDPDLRKTMVQEFGPVGMLRVRQAMNEGDAATVAAATSRYRGTDAAAAAYLWLADRAVSTGEFSRARGLYARARRIAGQALVEQIGPRDRLAAAMMGIDAGQPAVGIVKLGDVQLSAADFESLIAEMRRTHTSGAGLAGLPGGSGAAPAAPAPTGFDLKEIGRLDGDLGERPEDYGGMTPAREHNTFFSEAQRDKRRFLVDDSDFTSNRRPLDWTGRQIATATDGDCLYVSNRFQVAAFDIRAGKRKWQTGVGNDHGRTHEWSLTPMRPLLVGDRIFVRRLVKSGPELAALDRAGGQFKWASRSGLLVVSDPLWVQQSLVALTMTRVEKQSMLYLSTFDPSSGQVIAQERLASLHETWWDERTCQLTAVKDNFVAVFGGTVLSCDSSGKVRWVRRQEWISPREDKDWARQYQQQPLVWQDRLIVSQPGVAAVECMDAETGELYWRRPLPGLRRVTGVVDDRLIVETQDGLVGLNAAKGDVLWYHDVGDMAEGQLCGGPGRLLYVCRRRPADNVYILGPVLVWLDPATGAERANYPLDSLRHDHDHAPMLGPFAAVGDHLLAFSASGENEPTRTLLELVPKGSAMIVQETAAPNKVAGALRVPSAAINSMNRVVKTQANQN